MKNFLKLDDWLDPAPLLAKVKEMAWLWKEIQVRQQYEGSAHADTESIILKGPTSLEGLFDNLDSAVYDGTVHALSPEVMNTVSALGKFVGVRELGRTMLVKLKASGRITPHIDEGAYARFFARFHYVLSTSPQCLFTAGDETVHMSAGETWWFNHQVKHSVVNDGPDRVHLIFDATAPGFTGALSPRQ